MRPSNVTLANPANSGSPSPCTTRATARPNKPGRRTTVPASNSARPNREVRAGIRRSPHHPCVMTAATRVGLPCTTPRSRRHQRRGRRSGPDLSPPEPRVPALLLTRHTAQIPDPHRLARRQGTSTVTQCPRGQPPLTVGAAAMRRQSNRDRLRRPRLPTRAPTGIDKPPLHAHMAFARRRHGGLQGHLTVAARSRSPPRAFRRRSTLHAVLNSCG